MKSVRERCVSVGFLFLFFSIFIFFLIRRLVSISIGFYWIFYTSEVTLIFFLLFFFFFEKDIFMIFKCRKSSKSIRVLALNSKSYIHHHNCSKLFFYYYSKLGDCYNFFRLLMLVFFFILSFLGRFINFIFQSFYN